MLVAIDGPAGAGKSTVARALAHELGFGYLDTGAMYRAVALTALREGDVRSGAQVAAQARIELGPPVTVDGQDVTDAIRAPEVSEAASALATDPAVREAMVARQRRLISAGDWVAEGRDIGTVVAPDAELKVFLDASPAERARRRAAQLGGDPAQILVEQALRDQRDSARTHAPLRAADDAVTLDTTGLPLEEVVGRIVQLAGRATRHQATYWPT